MPDYTTLLGRRLIDGTGSAPVENPMILIQGSKIAAVGREGDTAFPQTEGSSKLDYRDKTLLPGLIDCHVHLCMSADDSPLARLYEDSDDMLLLRAANNAQLALKAGITTLRDCGGRNSVTFSIREAIAPANTFSRKAISSPSTRTEPSSCGTTGTTKNRLWGKEEKTRNPNLEIRKACGLGHLIFRISDLFRVSCFDIRV